jgi:hypothetical protein
VHPRNQEVPVRRREGQSERQAMSWQEYSLGLIEALALPGVVLLLGVLFYRPLRAISRRVQDDLAAGKALHIGAGGIRVGITERDDYQAQWHKPYDIKVTTTRSAGEAVKVTETTQTSANS